MISGATGCGITTNRRGSVRRIKRFISLCDCHPRDVGRPWLAVHPYIGSKTFKTWREAYDHANTRIVMMDS